MMGQDECERSAAKTIAAACTRIKKVMICRSVVHTMTSILKRSRQGFALPGYEWYRKNREVDIRQFCVFSQSACRAMEDREIVADLV